MSGPFNYIPFGDEPGQACPITSQDTYASVGAALSVVGSGGGGGGAVTSVAGVGSILVAPITGTVLVSLKNDVFASTLSLPVGGGQITGVSSINGAVYPPPAGSVPTNLEVSTITFPAGQGQLINVSTVNGAVYPPPAGSVPANLAVSTITFPAGQGQLINVSTVNGAPYGAGGSVPANLEVSTLTVAQTGNIWLNGNADINAFPSITWRNTNYHSTGVTGYSTICLDIQSINPYQIPPGAPDSTGSGTVYVCPTFEINGPDGLTTCPISVSGVIIGFDATQVSSPTLYTDSFAVSTLYIAATSSIALNTNTLKCAPALANVSSLNGVNWDYIVSTLAAVK